MQVWRRSLALREARTPSISADLARRLRRPARPAGIGGGLRLDGESERAIDIIQKLLKMPGYLCYGIVADPQWAPLRATTLRSTRQFLAPVH